MYSLMNRHPAIALAIATVLTTGALVVGNVAAFQMNGNGDLRLVTYRADDTTAEGVYIDETGRLLEWAKITLLDDNGDDLIEVREIVRADLDYELTRLGTAVDGITVSDYVPLGTCDDLSDCAKEIDDLCKMLGSKGKMSTLTAAETCDGTCADGQGVSIVCVKGGR